MTYKEHLIFIATRRDAGNCFLASSRQCLLERGRKEACGLYTDRSNDSAERAGDSE